MGSGWRVLRTTLPPSLVLVRAGAAGAAGSVTAAAAGAAGDCAAGALTSGWSGAGVETSGAGVSPSSSDPAAFFVAFLALVALAGSSGWTSRRSPSRSALRRARSAWASSMLELWLFTPIPRESARSSISLLVRPSSFASSCTRIFFCGNCLYFPLYAIRRIPSYALTILRTASAVRSLRRLRRLRAGHDRGPDASGRDRGRRCFPHRATLLARQRCG